MYEICMQVLTIQKRQGYLHKFYICVKTFECKFIICKRQKKSLNLYQTPSVIQEPPGLVLGGSGPERGGEHGGPTWGERNWGQEYGEPHLQHRWGKLT